MMKTKEMLMLAGVALAFGCAVFCVMAVRERRPALTEARELAGPEGGERALSTKGEPSTTDLPFQPKESVNPRGIEKPAPLTHKAGAAVQTQPLRTGPDASPQPISVAPPPGSQKAPAQDPLAREALSLVGENAEATEYWALAINDPDLPEEERKDLIEDLNEDGLSNAQHPGPEDVPLILNRIELIEELAPYAIDQVNADAFAEAYKDLIDMLDGRPVQ